MEGRGWGKIESRKEEGIYIHVHVHVREGMTERVYVCRRGAVLVPMYCA